jgi:hypothetical protein
MLSFSAPNLLGFAILETGLPFHLPLTPLDVCVGLSFSKDHSQSAGRIGKRSLTGKPAKSLESRNSELPFAAGSLSAITFEFTVMALRLDMAESCAAAMYGAASYVQRKSCGDEQSKSARSLKRFMVLGERQ